MSNSLELAWTQIVKTIFTWCVVTDVCAQLFLTFSCWGFFCLFVCFFWYPRCLHSSRAKNSYDKRCVCVCVCVTSLDFAWWKSTGVGPVHIEHFCTTLPYWWTFSCQNAMSLHILIQSCLPLQNIMLMGFRVFQRPSCLPQSSCAKKQEVIHFDFGGFYLFWRS